MNYNILTVRKLTDEPNAYYPSLRRTLLMPEWTDDDGKGVTFYSAKGLSVSLFVNGVFKPVIKSPRS